MPTHPTRLTPTRPVGAVTLLSGRYSKRPGDRCSAVRATLNHRLHFALHLALPLVVYLAHSSVQAQNALPTARLESASNNANANANAARVLTAKQHEAQLNAIRQAILQATLERPTRVLSSAWIDQNGALQESAHFHSEAQVRGVRVLSYLGEDPNAVPQVSAEVLPWGWRSSPAKSNTCEPPPRPWRLPLQVHTRVEPGFSGTQLFASLALLGSMDQAWTQSMQASTRWRTQPHVSAPDNAYLRALTGPNDNPTGWTAELVLKPHAPVQPFSVRQVWNQLGRDSMDWRWTLSFTLGERQTPAGPIEPRWQVEQVMTIDPLAAGQNPSAWLQQMKASVQLQMQAWAKQLNQRSACELVQFHVQRNGTEGLQLQAGAGSGLRPGDRVLLMSPNHIPSQMLEASATQHLALAQVVRVERERTELQLLAGPALPAQGHWVALPL